MMMKDICIDQPLFSVIVPAYNSAAFLDTCVKSVLGQTCPDFELILVDDGSKDATPELCDAYAKADRRVKAFHKENGGHTSARNRGLDASVGQYVIFLDSDDWLADDVLEICQKEIESNVPDIIVYQIYNTATKECFANHIPNGLYDCQSSIYHSLLMDECGESVFIKGLIGKVFKRERIMKNQLAVPHELRIAEDAAAFVAAAIDSSTICVNSTARYFYYVREGSVSHSSDRAAFFRLPFMFEYYKAKMESCSYDFSKQFDRYIVAQLYTALLLVMRSGAETEEINSGLKEVLRDPLVLNALKKAKFGFKGYKYIIKKFILRYRLWALAKFIDG